VAELFDLGDLVSWLQVPESAPGVPGSLDTATLTRVRRYASGWLQSATRLTSWPDPVPDDLFAWAIELAAIAFRNPDFTTQESLDDYSVGRQSDRARRVEILAAAGAKYGAAGSPVYSFPDPDWSWTVVASTTLD
jgi:hypothetical protein